MVKKSRPVVVWSNRASVYFKSAYERTKEESYKNAEMVKEGISKVVALEIGIPLQRVGNLVPRWRGI